jgi:GTP diphosphokinase / guanosine-3',5'-bis(diphosphate) 3'-diphosphatase
MKSFTKQEKIDIQNYYEELKKCCLRSKKKEDKELIQKAYNLAYEAHKQMRRKSGEPYIYHPLAVAKIVADEIGLGTKSIVSALLHDVVEDTDYTLEDISDMFGEKIADIVDGLTKIAGVFDKNTSKQAENFRKILLTLSDDVRVILIKLADRLHNMRTLSSMPPTKQLQVAGETLYLYAPLAHRLGLYAIKTELEDLSFKYRHAEIYDELMGKINADEKKRTSFINKFALPIADRLDEEKIQFDISGRPKSIFSVWNKMQKKNVIFEEIFDLFAIRIIFDPKPGIPEKTQCWNIYSMITDIYMPKPDRIRDWVSTPKANGYEALHSTVMGPYGKWVEVQIRSRRMDEIAERGFAAHWKYKGINSEESELDRWIKRIRELLENPSEDALEFLDEFKMNLFASEIIVFTPKGHLKSLPKSSTALDYAYEIHTEIGHHAIGAKVNHNLVPLKYKLKSGDQIEILTSDTQIPQEDWLDIAATARARTAIKDAFKVKRKKQLKEGKKILEEKLSELTLQPTSNIIRKLTNYFEAKTKDELYLNIGQGTLDLENLKKILRKKTQNKWIRYWKLSLARSSKEQKPEEEDTVQMTIDKKKPLNLEELIEEEQFIIAKCCNPIPGDNVLGYLKDEENIIIHKTSCPNALKLNSSFADRIVKAKWLTHKILSFLAKVKLNGIDRIGIVSQITNVLSDDLDVNMRSINFESHDGIFEGFIDLYVHSSKDLNNLIMNLMKIKGVESVKRIETTDE